MACNTAGARAVNTVRRDECTVRRAVLALVLFTTAPLAVRAQTSAAPLAAAGAAADLDSLVARALAVNPAIDAARARIDAARARIAPAGTLADPMLGIGVMNVPVSKPGFGDVMTMKTIAVAQMVPFPGKLPLARRAAEHELRAADADLRAQQLEVESQVRQAYFDLAFLDRALEILAQNQQVLVNFIAITESKYGVGTGAQQDVLKAHVETARLAEEAVALTEQRRTVLARLNALLDRPSETPVTNAHVPERIARAAVATSAADIRFATGELGGRAANSPLPPLGDLQERAIRTSPVLRAHEAAIAAQAAQLELARRAHLPDFDVSLQYGQRADRTDMVSFMVAVPVPLQRGRRQDQEFAEARASLAALEADHHSMINRLRAEIAARYSDVERNRAQLALFVRSIIPQGRASLQSATAAYQVGRTDFLALLENQATLFSYETAYFRTLTEFAKSIAELERIVAQEVLR